MAAASVTGGDGAIATLDLVQRNPDTAAVPFHLVFGALVTLIVVRKVVVLSLMFDHRVCDGDVPSQFIGFVANCIENPIGPLAEL